MNAETSARLQRQISFILEIDRLKSVFRQSYLLDRSRKENDAEHSWHLAVMAVILAKYAPVERLDVARVMKMVIVHDIVEIDAGDAFVYDDAAALGQAEREKAAAGRIFNILPEDQAREIRALWDEFEARETPEARFARALDRLEPLLLNYHTQGKSWREHGVARAQAAAKNIPTVTAGAPIIGEFVARLIDDALAKGYLGGDGA